MRKNSIKQLDKTIIKPRIKNKTKYIVYIRIQFLMSLESSSIIFFSNRSEELAPTFHTMLMLQLPIEGEETVQSFT